MARVASSCWVWLASILPLALPDSERWWMGHSRTGWCALPWLLCAGLPRTRSPFERETESEAWVWIALALPPMALAVRLDLAGGMEWGAVSVLALATMLATGLLGSSARACAGDEPRSQRYALAWTVLVPGAPFLQAALERGGAPIHGSAPSWLELAVRMSPLGWIAHEIARDGARDLSPAASAGSAASAWRVCSAALLPLCTCFALYALGRWRVRSRFSTETNP